MSVLVKGDDIPGAGPSDWALADQRL